MIDSSFFIAIFCQLYLGEETISKQADNPEHRKLSNCLDKKFGGKRFYDKAVRPLIHGTYHAARYFGYEAKKSFDPEEKARAKELFNKFGKSVTDYSKTLWRKILE